MLVCYAGNTEPLTFAQLNVNRQNSPIHGVAVECSLSLINRADVTNQDMVVMDEADQQSVTSL